MNAYNKVPNNESFEKKEIENVTGSDNFYQYEDNKNEEASSQDDRNLIDSFKKIEEQRTKINEIQSKYQKPKINFFDEKDINDSQEMKFK